MKKQIKYWCVEGERMDTVQEYVKARNKAQALKKAQEQMGEWFDEVPYIAEISKVEYEENNEN
jgi:hypothetical protein